MGQFCRYVVCMIVLTMMIFPSTEAFLNSKVIIARPSSLRVAIPNTSTEKSKYLIVSHPALTDEIRNDVQDIQEEALTAVQVTETENEITSQSTPNHNNFDLYSFLLLNMVVIIWGSEYFVTNPSMDTFPVTSLVNFWRFLISSILFSPSLIKHLRSKPKLESVSMEMKEDGIVRAGIELGFYTFLSFACQAISLETITASRSTFLFYTNVKFVPIISFLFFQRQYPGSMWASALLSFLGAAVLSTDGASMPSIGNAWCIAAAGASAMFIIRTASFSNLHNVSLLNSISFTTGTCNYTSPTHKLTDRLYGIVI
jgi:hypothetical protein